MENNFNLEESIQGYFMKNCLEKWAAG